MKVSSSQSRRSTKKKKKKERVIDILLFGRENKNVAHQLECAKVSVEICVRDRLFVRASKRSEEATANHTALR